MARAMDRTTGVTAVFREKRGRRRTLLTNTAIGNAWPLATLVVLYRDAAKARFRRAAAAPLTPELARANRISLLPTLRKNPLCDFITWSSSRRNAFAPIRTFPNGISRPRLPLICAPYSWAPIQKIFDCTSTAGIFCGLDV